MRVAVISDIHGNLEALRRITEDIESNGADKVFCLGDIVGYGPFPKQCLGAVRKLAEIIVGGNHEESVLDPVLAQARLSRSALAGVQFSRSKLTAHDLDFLATLPERKVVAELGLALAHGSYSAPSAWNYVEGEEEADVEMAHAPARISVVGHTHMPDVFAGIGGRVRLADDNIELKAGVQHLINVGSVGQPRDGDSRSSYGLFEFKGRKIFFRLRRVEYDIQKTARAIWRSGLPEGLGDRLFRGY